MLWQYDALNNQKIKKTYKQESYNKKEKDQKTKQKNC